MKMHSQKIITDLLRSARAIRYLDSQGVIVRAVLAGGCTPKLLIESPVPAVLQGHITKRVMMHDKHVCTFNAYVFGVIVEWVEVKVVVQQETGHASLS